MKDKKLGEKVIRKMIGKLGNFVYKEIWDEDAGVRLGDVIQILGTVQAIFAIKNAASEEDISETAEMLAESNKEVCMPIAVVMVGAAARMKEELENQPQDQPTTTIH